MLVEEDLLVKVRVEFFRNERAGGGNGFVDSGGSGGVMDSEGDT